MEKQELIMHIYRDGGGAFFAAYPDFKNCEESNVVWLPNGLGEQTLETLEYNGMSFSIVPEYYSLRFTLNLLRALTEHFPPAPRTRHNITLAADGTLEITLMLEGGCVSAKAEVRDLDLDSQTLFESLRQVFDDVLSGRCSCEPGEG